MFMRKIKASFNVIIVALISTSPGIGAAGDTGKHWIGTWATAAQPAQPQYR